MNNLPPLNIITAVSRPDNLVPIYYNLSSSAPENTKWFTIFEPLHSDAVRAWAEFVDTVSGSEKPGHSRLEVTMAVGGRDGGWGGSKRTFALTLIKSGWCYFLDDDNLLHSNLAGALLRARRENPVARVIVFCQCRGDGRLRLNASAGNMRPCHFDTGQFVIDREFVGDVSYTPTASPWSTIWPDTGTGDWAFIKRFWEANPEHFLFVPEVATYYNALI
jgi:hypothetical protein